MHLRIVCRYPNVVCSELYAHYWRTLLSASVTIEHYVLIYSYRALKGSCLFVFSRGLIKIKNHKTSVHRKRETQALHYTVLLASILQFNTVVNHGSKSYIEHNVFM